MNFSAENGSWKVSFGLPGTIRPPNNKQTRNSKKSLT